MGGTILLSQSRIELKFGIGKVPASQDLWSCEGRCRGFKSAAWQLMPVESGLLIRYVGLTAVKTR